MRLMIIEITNIITDNNKAKSKRYANHIKSMMQSSNKAKYIMMMKKKNISSNSNQNNNHKQPAFRRLFEDEDQHGLASETSPQFKKL